MPKRIPENELEAILDIVNEHPAGVGASVIHEKLPMQLHKRTLNRRLSLLIGQHRLVAEGQRKSRRYRLPHVDINIGVQAGKPTSHVEVGYEFVLSSAGKSLQGEIRKPLRERRSVGYERDFLDDYQPNVSFYLPHETRQELLSLGQQAETDNPAGTFVRSIYDRLLIELAWNSSRLEGNTYSLLDTDLLLNSGVPAEGKTQLETQMVLNHKAAVEFLVGNAETIGFDRYTILNLHALLADNLLGDAQSIGRLRRNPVSVAGSTYIPLTVSDAIEECFDKILEKTTAITDPFEQSFFALTHLAYLQGFLDVNKRLSRLAANIPLIRSNLCPLSFAGLPPDLYISGLLTVYELNRIELLCDVYVGAYKRSSAAYSVMRRTVFNPFQLRYRDLISELVAMVVNSGLSRQVTGKLIRQRAIEDVPSVDRLHFIEAVELEILNLHEGNIARHRIELSDFRAWRRLRA